MALQSSDYQLSKRAKSEDSVFVDRFSLLPQSILVYIISFLSLEESARTSVLSKYWRGLWLSTARLDFDASELSRKLAARKRRKQWWGLAYAEWVHKVVRAHKSANSGEKLVLDEFRIHFQLDHYFESDVDNWLRYAFSMNVRSLELDLMKRKSYPSLSSDPYFRMPRLFDRDCEHSEEFSINHFKKTNRTIVLTEFRFLRSLSLAGVDVFAEVVDFFLRKFPALESLKVCNSPGLVSLKICGQSRSLKHLEITDCVNFECLIVRYAQLVSLKVSWIPEFVLENVPMLVDLSVSASRVRQILPQLASNLSTVRVLTLSVKSYDVIEDGARVAQLPELPEVKELILIVEKIKDDDLIHLTSMTRAMPNLEKFVVKLIHMQGLFMSDKVFENPSSFPLQHLKVFELCGYRGLAGEDGLIMYLQQNALALKKIIIDPCDLFVAHYKRRWNKRKSMFVETVRSKAVARAEKLKGVVSSSVELVVV